MWEFISELKQRNEVLFWFGMANLVAALVFIVLSRATDVQVHQVSAWHKPFKFAIATCIYSWSMAWYCHYLPNFNIGLFNLAVVVMLGFEVAYIAIQAGKGELSHFNISTPFYGSMFSLMAVAITIVVLYTAWVGVLFFIHSFPDLPVHYVWAIRMGIILFVVFSFQGFLMGARLSHTVGAPDGGRGLPLLNWSTRFGDLRVAHFAGMHALQILPILSFYILKNIRLTLIAAFLYGCLAVFTLVQALQSRPLIRTGKAPQAQSEYP